MSCGHDWQDVAATHDERAWIDAQLAAPGELLANAARSAGSYVPYEGLVRRCTRCGLRVRMVRPVEPVGPS